MASSLRLAGTGAQQSLWPTLPSLPMPVLLVAGQLDAKFTAIAERMAALIPDAVVEIIAGAGHVVHLERPTEFLEVLRRWLDATPVGPAARDVSRSTRRAAVRTSSARRRPAVAGRSAPSTAISAGPLAPPTTWRTGARANTTAASPMSAAGRQIAAPTTSATNVAATRAT